MMDRSSWCEYSFSEIAKNIVERTMPTPDDKDTYIGLEHMDSGSLHITRWGSQTELIGEKLKIEKGDVLFARRNAYLKRAAVAPFDGVFSAHGMVLRPIESVISPRFFPFFIFSDTFLDRAIQISVGSLSPTINWTALKKEKFLLPPIDEQERIAEVLWAADEVVVNYSKVFNDTCQLRNTYFNNWVSERLMQTQPFVSMWTKSPENGCSAPEPAQPTGHYVLSLSALSRNGYVSGCVKRAIPTPQMLKAVLKKGDLLISRSNTSELVGLVGIFDDQDNISYPDTMMRLRIDESKAYKEYIEIILLSEYGRTLMKKICAGTSSSMKKINRKTLGEIPIPIVSLNEQNCAIEHNKSFNRLIDNSLHHMQGSQKLLNTLLKNYLGGAN